MSNHTNQNREEALFEQVLKLDSEAERMGFLKGACSDDPALYQRLVDLVAAHAQDENFIQTVDRAPDLTEVGSPAWEGPGSLIGRYKLLQQIGEGGMGAVYMAQQEEPVQRKVALKIIKVGMDTKHVVARFEAERQALAMMDHPNIARVHDGGATDTGRPYFVMELVQGVPITEYCDKNNLSLSERLDLFIPVCHAIHSAHRKGIIHRDIKPSNVLVTLHHGEPMPKVIDFGIAKATNQKLTEKTLFTQFSQMIGTPAYMSPEQAEMSSMDVDTRTDIYSLGVLLYELLTGTTPLPAKRLKDLAYGEMQRVIAEEEPPMPSTCLGTMEDATKTAVAKQRSIDARGLAQQFKGDIDWIVMKCLEKDRRRRYETPKELVADLQSHLSHEPVSAAAPSLSYQLQKFVRRYKPLVAATAAVIAVSLLGAVAASWQAVRATKAKRKAEAAEQTANQAVAKESELRHELSQKFYRSLVNQARLARLNRNPGFRTQAASYLRQAAALDTNDDNQTELRNEAIAAMVVPLSSEIIPIDFTPPKRATQIVRFNQRFDEVALLEDTGILTLVQLDPITGRSRSSTLETEPIIDCRFGADGLFLVTLHRSGHVRIWNREPTNLWNLFNEITEAVSGSAIQATTEALAVGRNAFVILQRQHNQVLHWQEFSDRTPEIHTVPSLSKPLQVPHDPSLSPDGQLLVFSHDSSNVIQVWNLHKQRLMNSPPIDFVSLRNRHDFPLFTKFSPNGEHLGISISSEFRLLDTTSLQIAFSYESPGFVGPLSFSPDSNRIIGAQQKQILNLDTFSLDHSLERHHGNFHFSGREEGFYQWGLGHRNVSFLPERNNTLITLKGHQRNVRELIFHPTKPIALTSSFDASVRKWHINEPIRESTLVETQEFTPGDIAFSPDHAYFATVVRDTQGTVSIRNAETFEVVQQFELGVPAFGVAFASPENYLAVGGIDTVKVWTYEQVDPAESDGPFRRQLHWEFSEPGLGWVSEVKFSPSGRYLAVDPGGMSLKDRSKAIYIVDLATQTQLPSDIKTGSKWRGFDFISESRIACVGTSLQPEIWNFRTNQKERTIQTGLEEVRNLGVSKHGRYLAFHSYSNRQGFLAVYDIEKRETLFNASIMPANVGATAVRWNNQSTLIGLPCSDSKTRILNLSSIRQELAELGLDWE